VSLALLSAFVYFLASSTNLQLIFMRSKVPFQVTESGRTIVNHFTLKLSRQGEQNFKLNFRVSDVELASKINIVTPVQPTILSAPQKKIVIFFKFSPDILISGSRKIKIEV